MESPEQQIRKHENKAYKRHKILVSLGGRPSRPIQREPVYRISDGEGGVTIRHTTLDREFTVEAPELMIYHWWLEGKKVKHELSLWQAFKLQQAAWLNFPTAIRNSDISVQTLWKSLNDWRDFEMWHSLEVARHSEKKENSRRALEKMKHQFSLPIGSRKQSFDLSDDLWSQLEEIRQHKYRITESMIYQRWIGNQYTEILKGASDVVMRMCEEAMRAQAHGIYQELKRLGLRCGMLRPSSVYQPTCVQGILHWKDEYLRLSREKANWNFVITSCGHGLPAHVAERDRQLDRYESAAALITSIDSCREEYETQRDQARAWRRIQVWVERIVSHLDAVHSIYIQEHFKEIQTLVDLAFEEVTSARNRLEMAEELQISVATQQRASEKRIQQSRKGIHPSSQGTHSTSPRVHH